MTRIVLFATSALTLASPAASPAAAQVDPVAREMAAQALSVATAPTTMKTTIVGGEQPNTPAVSGASGTIGNSPIQVNGSAANDTGYLAFKYGADGKGVTNYWVKTRSPVMNGYAAIQNGDRIVVDLWQAGTGGQTGHVGGTRVTVDNAVFSAGEVAGRWALFTGTGVASSQVSRQYPVRYGTMNAIVANSYQQVIFPGGVNPALPSAGSNFGGWVVIGAGAASPGFGALKFLRTGAALLATPEAGAFEVDANALPYFTAADGVRRGIMLAETTDPSVTVLPGAGSGATATIDANGNAGIVLLVTGAGIGPKSGAGAGDLFTVTYAHPYPSASYPVISAANAAAVALVRNGYLTATATGFTVSQPSTGDAALPAGTYAVTFNAPGA
ncbi:hypothetical protein [Sphingomonas sp. UV9]|uniref:hypothetical protein n=1 Tax=Sphingomonas sp. UV9 TaxID=1851410 RepID=UPI0013E8B485|nr:hypothetical protein [Sphingomonas sp. UV9]